MFVAIFEYPVSHLSKWILQNFIMGAFFRIYRPASVSFGRFFLPFRRSGYRFIQTVAAKSMCALEVIKIIK